MTKTSSAASRREEALTRDRIVEASIELLDASGEGGLTFRALSERLCTGPGAIYWHIKNKSDLLAEACDTLVARTMNACVRGRSPKANVRAIAVSLFDALDAHPWAGSALTDAPGQSSVLRVLERIGRELAALHVPKREQWVAVSTLLHYIIGVGGHNAANGQLARARGLDRDDFLKKTSSAWSQLDPEEYPFARSIAGQFQAHDDRTDFLAGIDFILRGIGTASRL